MYEKTQLYVGVSKKIHILQQVAFVLGQLTECHIDVPGDYSILIPPAYMESLLYFHRPAKYAPKLQHISFTH
jgi:hypothetical protein